MHSFISPGWRKSRPASAPLIATQIYSPEFIVLLFTQATMALLADNHQLYNWEYLQTLGGAELDRFHDYAAIGTMFSTVLLPSIFLVVGYLVYRARAARPTFTAHVSPWLVRNNLAIAAGLSLASLGLYEYFPAQTTLFAVLRLGITLAIVPFALYSFYYLFAYQSHGRSRTVRPHGAADVGRPGHAGMACLGSGPRRAFRHAAPASRPRCGLAAAAGCTASTAARRTLTRAHGAFAITAWRYVSRAIRHRRRPFGRRKKPGYEIPRRPGFSLRR
jgi:hypothetical protein